MDMNKPLSKDEWKPKEVSKMEKNRYKWNEDAGGFHISHNLDTIEDGIWVKKRYDDYVFQLEDGSILNHIVDHKTREEARSDTYSTFDKFATASLK